MSDYEDGARAMREAAVKACDDFCEKWQLYRFVAGAIAAAIRALPLPTPAAGETTKGALMIEHISQFFQYAHLPAHLQEVSKPFSDLAESIVQTLPRNPERTVALRKLLEAKDAAVRAKLAQDV